MRSIVAALAALAVSFTTTLAHAQAAFPERTIRIVVPFAAGGGADVVARLIAEKAHIILGVPVIVENRAGASGTLGGLAVKQSAPDGYTLLFAPITHVMSNYVLNAVPYHAVNDFTAISRSGESPLMVVMSNKMPQRTLAEVAAAARERPADWTVATSGLGSAGHIASIELRNAAKAELTI